MNHELYRVVGVLPEAFTFMNPDVRVYAPIAFTAQEKSEEQRWSQNHEAVGRLAAGVSIEQAQARLDAIDVRIVESAGALKSAIQNAKYHSVVRPLELDVVRDVRGALELLWGGVLFVLLIAYLFPSESNRLNWRVILGAVFIVLGVVFLTR